MHFGNCNSAEYGRGTCIEKADCEFYDVEKLTDFASKRQCFSRQRPDLVSVRGAPGSRNSNLKPPPRSRSAVLARRT